MATDDKTLPEITHPKKRAFLVAYAQTGSITKAAEAAEMLRRNHYNWIRDDADYAELFNEAREIACEYLEDVARLRATEGWEEPVYYKGDECGTIRKFSDTLLIFLLKGNNPQKFADKHISMHDHHHTITVDQRRERLTALDERLGLGGVVDALPAPDPTGDSSAAQQNGHAGNGQSGPGSVPPTDND